MSMALSDARLGQCPAGVSIRSVLLFHLLSHGSVFFHSHDTCGGRLSAVFPLLLVVEMLSAGSKWLGCPRFGLWFWLFPLKGCVFCLFKCFVVKDENKIDLK